MVRAFDDNAVGVLTNVCGASHLFHPEILPHLSRGITGNGRSGVGSNLNIRKVSLMTFLTYRDVLRESLCFRTP